MRRVTEAEKLLRELAQRHNRTNENISMPFLMPRRPRQLEGRPGEIIEALTPEQRKLLEGLQSSDVKHVDYMEKDWWPHGPRVRRR